MALKLIPPGKRGNRYYLIRGRMFGRAIEFSTRSGDPLVASYAKAVMECMLIEDEIAAKIGCEAFDRVAAHVRAMNAAEERSEAEVEASWHGRRIN